MVLTNPDISREVLDSISRAEDADIPGTWLHSYLNAFKCTLYVEPDQPDTKELFESLHASNVPVLLSIVRAPTKELPRLRIGLRQVLGRDAIMTYIKASGTEQTLT